VKGVNIIAGGGRVIFDVVELQPPVAGHNRTSFSGLNRAIAK
jgi:arginase family enzyme